jgi:hypothetical protein
LELESSLFQCKEKQFNESKEEFIWKNTNLVEMIKEANEFASVLINLVTQLTKLGANINFRSG